MPGITSKNFRTDASLLFVVIIWGLNFPILKGALAAMHPFVLNAFRFMVSAGVLGAVYVVRQRNGQMGLREMVRRYGRQILLLGIIGFILYQFSFILGIDNTFAGNAALIIASSPLWTAAVSHVLGLERIRKAAWGGLLVSLAGTAVVVFGGSQQIDFASATFLGNLLIFVAAAMWGGYTALARPLLQQITPSSLSFMNLLVGLPLLLGVSIPHFPAVQWEQVDVWVWLAILYSGGLSTGITYVIWNAAVQKVGAAQTAIFGNLVPFIAVIASYFLLGEPITFTQLAGGVLIIGGLFLARRGREG